MPNGFANMFGQSVVSLHMEKNRHFFHQFRYNLVPSPFVDEQIRVHLMAKKYMCMCIYIFKYWKNRSILQPSLYRGLKKFYLTQDQQLIGLINQLFQINFNVKSKSSRECARLHVALSNCIKTERVLGNIYT